MPVFKLGFNKVTRRVVLPNLKAAAVVDLPAGAHVRNVYTKNDTTTASNLTAGNVAAGAQYVASAAVGVADGTGPQVTVHTVINPGISKVASSFHVTLSAYPIKNPTAPAAQQKGGISVVIEYTELLDGLPEALRNKVRAY
jgi:hypothetical protein